ncbi:MAG: N-6 DNA methylase, partial [Gemmatimonadota bacterium]|nr:N-6 DNA methylase [Gemmatimonadota bacterium]
MHPLETYLREVRAIRDSGAGVAETSYYPAVSTLLNEAGRSLRPPVRCIINLRNRGGGIPDGGLFTPDQFARASDEEPQTGQLPARGALEVKGAGEDLSRVIAGEQVRRYVERYGQVLVTNLREWVLVAGDGAGGVKPLESYQLAKSEGAFWDASRNAHRTAEEHGDGFLAFLRLVMLRAAPLTDPQELAWVLAWYAREARTRSEQVKLPALASLRGALEEALGMEFHGARGEHFFRSTLVQTLFYGIFSAWVLWSRQGGTGRFEWRTAGWTLRVPAIRALFHQITDPDRLFRLGLVETLDWAAEALNRVDRAAFFTRFQEEHAVQYFYEPFLEAFDPGLRKELGVWYTPPEVVKYMVARVDTVLKEELGIADGLADPRVLVLDPCCGTGAYLVEVLDHIAAVLRERGEDALLAAELRRAATERVFGFEILPAPFVVAHLQLGLLLQSYGASGEDQPETRRVGVYLTNALTGWGPPPDEQKTLAFPELQAEHDAAEAVKRKDSILVVLGNPPYNGYPGLAIGEERDLVHAYRTAKRAPKPQGQGLNDLYVRFFRMAERRIVEMTGKGVVCFISNYSWLDGLSFTGMRERYLEAFDRIWIDSLNGDKYRTGKLTPGGEPDPSVF